VALGDNDDVYFVDIVCGRDGGVCYERSVKREFSSPSPASTIGAGGFRCISFAVRSFVVVVFCF
jgi:hypothetical protein